MLLILETHIVSVHPIFYYKFGAITLLSLKLTTLPDDNPDPDPDTREYLYSKNSTRQLFLLAYNGGSRMQLVNRYTTIAIKLYQN